MQQNDWVKEFDDEMRLMIDKYVQQQDFHAVETPLKTDLQYKNDLRNRLLNTHNYNTISKGIFNAVTLINEHLLAFCDSSQIDKVHHELQNAFKTLSERLGHYSRHEDLDQQWVNQLDANVSLWTALYGISDETLLLIYEIVLKRFNNQEINNSKDLLEFLLIFAPTVPAYWNALGFCLQSEGNFDDALNYYLIAEQIDENILDTHFYLARCYAAMNQRPLAQEQVKKLFNLVASSDQMKEQWESHLEQISQEVSGKKEEF